MTRTLAVLLSAIVVLSVFTAGIALTGPGGAASVLSGTGDDQYAHGDDAKRAGGGGPGGGGPGHGDSGDADASESDGARGGSAGAGRGAGGGPPTDHGGEDHEDDGDEEETEEDALAPGNVSSFGTIDSPGYYYLTDDIDGDGVAVTAFEIKSGDVILDGRGHTISNGTGEAVHVLGTGASLSNVTITNLRITGWESGISAMNVEDSLFEDLVVEGNDDAGIVLQASSGTSDNRLVGVTIRDNEKGVFLRESVTRTTILDSRFEANHEAGLKASGASETTIRDTLFTRHDGEKALHFTGNSPNNTLVGTVVTESAASVENAIQFGGESANNTLVDNVVRDNALGGISIGPGGNTLVGNAIHDNGDVGLTLEGDGNVVRENAVFGNRVGVLLLGSGNELLDNDVHDNVEWDLRLAEDATADFEALDLDGEDGLVVDGRATDVALRAAALPGPLPAGFTDVGRFVEANGTGETAHLSLAVPYDGVSRRDAEALRMWRYADGNWSLVGDVVYRYDGHGWVPDTDPAVNGVDLDAGYVYVEADAFGVFAPLTGAVDAADADFAVTSTAVDAATVSTGDLVTVSATVANGGEEAAEALVELTVDGDVVDGRRVTVPAGAAVPVSFEWSTPWPGTYALGVSGVDAADVTVVDTQPPRAVVDESVDALAYELVTLDAGRSTDNVGVVAYDWQIDGVSLHGETVTHRLPAGVYVATVTVADAAGNTDAATVLVTVTADDVLPAAVPSVGDDATAGDPVTFDASDSTDNAYLDSYAWDFGDGTTAEGATVAHAYAAPGDYAVTLTVTDASGNVDTATITVSVAAAPSRSTGGSGGGASARSGGTAAAGGSGGSGGSVTTARGRDGALLGNATDVRAGEWVRFRFPWADPDGETGLHLREMAVVATHGGDLRLRVHTRTTPDARTPAFDGGRGEPAGYLVVAHSGDASTVERAQFALHLSAERLAARGVDPANVSLYRYHDRAWIRVQTRHVASEGGQHEFVADAPGLSTFAVVYDGGSALSVASTSLSATDVAPGETVFVDATVTNDGVAAATFDVGLAVDGETVDEEAVTLGSGEARVVSLAAALDDPGSYDLSVGGVAVGTVSVADDPAAPTTDAAPTADAGTTTQSEAATDGATPVDERPGDGAGAALVAALLLAVLGSLVGVLWLLRR